MKDLTQKLSLMEARWEEAKDDKTAALTDQE
jgi:hypothetical protein